MGTTSEDEDEAPIVSIPKARNAPIEKSCELGEKRVIDGEDVSVEGVDKGEERIETMSEREGEKIDEQRANWDKKGEKEEECRNEIDVRSNEGSQSSIDVVGVSNEGSMTEEQERTVVVRSVVGKNEENARREGGDVVIDIAALMAQFDELEHEVDSPTVTSDVRRMESRSDEVPYNPICSPISEVAGPVLSGRKIRERSPPALEGLFSHVEESGKDSVWRERKSF